MPGFSAVGKRPVAGGTGRKWTGFLVARGSGFAVEHGASSRFARPPNGHYAASFDGTTGHVALPAVPLTDAGAFTIEAWIKKTTSTSQRSFFSNRGGSGHIYAGITGAHPFMFINGGTPASFNGVDALAVGTVYHIVFTSDGATSRAYVNGALNASLAQTIPVTDPSTGAGIGYDPALPTEFWDGSIDNVRVYRRCLSAAEVAARAAGTEIDTTGLVGWWRLNDGAGATVQDSSGLGRNGTITGGVSFGPGLTLDGPYTGNAVAGGKGVSAATTSRFAASAATGAGRESIITLGLHYSSGIASVTGAGYVASTTLPIKFSHLLATVGGLVGCGGVPTYLGRPGSQHVPEDIRITTDRAGNAVALFTQRPARPPVASELPASRAASSAPDRQTSRKASGVPTSTMRRAE